MYSFEYFFPGRVITVSSHCARTTLPGLALYSSTKAALRAWSDGLRLELAKYGVAVVQFVPGNQISPLPPRVAFKIRLTLNKKVNSQIWF